LEKRKEKEEKKDKRDEKEEKITEKRKHAKWRINMNMQLTRTTN
jgi:hypothetical protein